MFHFSKKLFNTSYTEGAYAKVMTSFQSTSCAKTKNNQMLESSRAASLTRSFYSRRLFRIVTIPVRQ